MSIAPPAIPTIAIRGSDERFGVHRIYCVGRNFADHAKEMGAAIEKASPILFCKPADAIVCGPTVPFARGTTDLHHEVELVVALGRSADGEVSLEQAASFVYAYAVGLDLTRRDLQSAAKAKGLPWDTAKAFDHSAPISDLVLADSVQNLLERRMTLKVNGQVRQSAMLKDMIFSIEEVIHELSKLFDLKAGDLIFMGTPAGVAAVKRGDQFEARIDDVVSFQAKFV